MIAPDEIAGPSEVGSGEAGPAVERRGASPALPVPAGPAPVVRSLMLTDSQWEFVVEELMFGNARGRGIGRNLAGQLAAHRLHEWDGVTERRTGGDRRRPDGGAS